MWNKMKQDQKKRFINSETHTHRKQTVVAKFKNKTRLLTFTIAGNNIKVSHTIHVDPNKHIDLSKVNYPNLSKRNFKNNEVRLFSISFCCCL